MSLVLDQLDDAAYAADPTLFWLWPQRWDVPLNKASQKPEPFWMWIGKLKAKPKAKIPPASNPYANSITSYSGYTQASPASLEYFNNAMRQQLGFQKAPRSKRADRIMRAAFGPMGWRK